MPIYDQFETTVKKLGGKHKLILEENLTLLMEV
jgi:hypothetical protein